MLKLLPAAGVSVLLLVLPRTIDPDAASLGGRVTDQNTTPIEAARISARNKFSGEVEIVESDAAGLYKIDRLQQGRYSVFAHAEGYGCAWVLNVFLCRGEYTNLDLVLTRSGKKVPSANCLQDTRNIQ